MNCRPYSTPPRRTWGWLKAGLFGAALALFGTVQAQLPMTLSQFTGSYSAISTGGGATTWTGAVGDDVTQSNVPINFSFNYLGTPYTSVAICNSGWISFNATTTSTSFSNTDMYSTSGPQLALFPWFDDHNFNLNSVTATAPTILYQTQGTSPNQTFTVQWTNVNAGRTAGGSALNFQVILYESTNVIEFMYGPVTNGAYIATQSASIGIEGATGGPGNYMDAMTGNSRCGHSYLARNQWPAYNFRFTPGTPSVLAGGTYNVGVGQTYPNLTAAVADVQQRGVSGAVTLNLVDAVYDTSAAGGNNMFPILLGPIAGSSATNTVTITKTGSPAAIRWGGNVTGETGGNMYNGVAAATINTSNVEPIIGLCGADYVTVNNVDIRGNVGFQNADHAIGIYNNTATDGSQFNTFSNFSTIMRRANTGSRGVQMNTTTTPTSAAGANSNNTFRDFSITNCYSGIVCNNSSTTQAFPDLATTINRTNCATFNTIGDPATANDIGNGTTATSGISLTGQSGFICANNSVRNVTASAAAVNGIDVVTYVGIPFLNNNIIRGVRNSSTSSTTAASGIRMSCSAAAGSHRMYCYNNAISDINSGYTGSATATRTLKGINILTGGASTSYYDVWHNSVSINASGSPNLSSVCLETGTSTGPYFVIKDNVFANYSPANATSRHYGIAHTSATTIGPASTSITNNDIYIQNDVNVSGFTAIGNTTNYNGVAAWQAAITSPAGAVAANIEVDPVFADATANLHTAAAALNGGGVPPPGYYTTDLDCATRTPDDDIGAFILNGCTGAPTAGTIGGTNSVCAGTSNTLTLSGASTGLGISYQWKYGTTPGGPYTTNLGTSLTQATTALTTGVYYVVVDVTCNSGPTTSTTAEFTMTIKQVPTASASNNGPICAGQTLNLTGTTDVGNSYAWTGPGGYTSTSQNPSIVSATSAAGGVYSFVATLNGCSSTAATTTAVVNFTPTINGTTATPNPTCFNGNSQLNVTATFPGAANAYTFSTSTGAALDPMTGATTIVSQSTDDAPMNTSAGANTTAGAPINIGFAFAFNGVAYSQFSASPDGWILLGGAQSVSEFSNVTTSTSNIPKIYPYWDDLATGTTGSVKSLVTGSAPNRILKVQWNVTIPRATTGAPNSTFQCWLYEADNSIEFRYGTMGTPTSGSISSGLTAAAANFQSITFSTHTASTVTGNDANTTAPASGRMYRFAQPALTGGTYAWSPITFLNDATLSNPVASGVNVASAPYTVQVTAANGCSSTGNVTLTTSAPITSASITGNLSFCTGSSTTLTAVPGDGAGPYTYLWSPNGETTASIPVNVAGSYSCQVTDNCGGSVSTGSVTVVENPVPTASASSNQGCTGQTLNLTGTTDIGTSYNWSGPNSFTSTQQNPSITGLTNAAAGVYTFTATLNGCTSLPATTTVTVNPTPNIISTTATPGTICPGGSSQLQVNLPAPSAYCTTVNFTNNVEAIGNVTFSDINNSSACVAGAGAGGVLQDFTSVVGHVTAGSVYPMTVTGTTDGNFTTYMTAFFDWNQDGVFEAQQAIGSITNTACGTTATNNVTVPVGAFNGSTRMRVVKNYNSSPTDPCGSYGYGQAEDYTLVVSGGLDPYTYSWSPAGNLNNAAIANPLSTIATPGTTENYTVTVSSAGCSAQGTTSVTVAVVDDGDPCTADVCTNGVVTNTYQDSDSDGTCDGLDGCPNDPNKITAGICGCGVSDVDTDADGTADCNDGCPNDPNKITAGICGCGVADTDTDADGTADCNDGCPTDPNKTAPGLCGCGVAEGTCQDCLGVPSGPAQPGTPCDDGDVCTINDLWSPSCVCVGTFQDTDGDGVCDANDNCPTVVGQIGSSCDDNDACTSGDVLDANCVCVGTPLTPSVTIAAGGPTTFCAGGSVTLTATPSNTCPTVSYAWFLNGSTPVGTNSATYVANGSGSYTCTVTNGNSLTGNSNAIAVTVNPLPTVGVTASSPVYCTPGPGVTLTASGASSYVWNGANLSATTGNPVTATPSGTTLYTVTGTDDNGCSNTAQVTITTGTTPTITGISATPATVCPGGSSQLLVSTPALTYCVPSLSTGCSFPDQISNVNVAGIVRSSGCDNTSGSNGYSYFSSGPSGALVAGSSGNSYSITTSGDVEGAALWIDYNNNGTFENPSELVFNSFAGSNPATYTGTFTVPAGAVNGVTRLRVRCTYNGAPGTSACTGTQTTYGETEDYNVTISGGVPANSYTYNWTPGTYLSSTTIANPVASGVMTSTPYTAMVTNGSGCSATANITLNVETTDTDNDGTVDCLDGCPTDPNKIAPGICGCGVADTDSDSDGTADCFDGCPNDPNKTAPGICGCGVADTDTDSDGTADCNDGCPTDPNKIAPGVCGCGVADTDTDSDGTADCIDNCPNVTGQIGSPCSDGDVNTINDALDANCQCVGTVVTCSQNTLLLDLSTDGAGSETSWDVVNSGTTTVVCSGTGYSNNQNVTLACCLPNGCYDLRVFDAGGDGINPGGYVLRNGAGQRIIDNSNNGFAFASLSEVRDVNNAPVSFCLPIGTDAMVSTSCDVLDATVNTVLQAAINPAVASGTAATSGYQFWVYNPNGSYSRRIFQSVSSPGTGWPVIVPTAERPAYLRLGAMSSAPAIPQFVLLNIRVRSRVNNVNAEFGPACQLKLDPTGACQTSQLTSVGQPVNPAVSCGASVPRSGGVIYANTVTGATTYQFEFTAGAYLRRIASPTRQLTLGVWATNPLSCNTTYNVRVRVSFDGGNTYCPFGTSCPLTVTCPSFTSGNSRSMDVEIGSNAVFEMYPNPNRGDNVTLRLSQFDASVDKVTVDFYDAFGKRVLARVIPVTDSNVLNTVIELGNDMSAGMYMVNVTAGSFTRTERLVIQR